MTHATGTRAAGRAMRRRATTETLPAYRPEPGAKCDECGKDATIYCPACKRHFCDDCNEVAH